MSSSTQMAESVNDRIKSYCSIQKLISMLTPHSEWPVSTRRYHCLRDVLSDDTDIDTGIEVIPGKWEIEEIQSILLNKTNLLPGAQRLNVLRTLGILYWEWAQSNGDEEWYEEEVRKSYSMANFLWKHLLTDDAFWSYFAQEHVVKDEHLDEVKKQIIEGTTRPENTYCYQHCNEIRNYVYCNVKSFFRSFNKPVVHIYLFERTVTDKYCNQKWHSNR